MSALSSLPPALGALAILSTSANFTFSIIFSVSLLGKPMRAEGFLAIVDAALNTMSAALLGALLRRIHRERYRYQEKAWRRSPWRPLTQPVMATCLVSTILTIILYVWMYTRISHLLSTNLKTSMRYVLLVAIIFWAISVLAQLGFFTGIVLRVRHGDVRAQQSRSGSLRAQKSMQAVSEPSHSSEMQEKARAMESLRPHSSMTNATINDRLGSSRPSSVLKRASSDTMSSFRSTVSHAVRPISSKTRLISKSQKSITSTFDSQETTRRNTLTSEEGFDTWDTSAVDPQSRQIVNVITSSSMAPSPIPGTHPARLLETIPASPTASRSPSPGFPLDLVSEDNETSLSRQGRRRSRSDLTSASYVSLSRRDLDQLGLPMPPGNTEANIHPLFRSDSPTPPPAITPGSAVTALPRPSAVGLGISRRASETSSTRSLSRMRSGSSTTAHLPSPLLHSRSFDSSAPRAERRSVREDDDGMLEGPAEGMAARERGSEIERQITPPIPAWVLESGRTSAMGWQKKKGLGSVSEAEGL